MNESNTPNLGANAIWRIASFVVKLGLQFVTLVVLSWLLPVEAFGQIAFAMIFVNLINLGARLGVGPAIIQHPQLDDAFLRTSFTVSLIAGVAGCLFLVAIAPLIAKDENTQWLIQMISCVFVFMSLGNVSEALLQRNFKFKYIFFVEVISYFISYTILAIVLALNGFGVWSIAFAMVISALVRSSLLYIGTWHSLKLSLSTGHVRQILAFGGGVTVAVVFYFLSQNADYYFVDLYLGVSALALYSRAYYMVRLPSDIINRTLNTVLLPKFSRIQDDLEQLRIVFLNSAIVSSYITLPLTTVLIIIGPELILVLFGKEWNDAILPFQILSIIGYLTLYTIGDALLVALGQLRIQIAIHFLFASMVAIFTLVGIKHGMSFVAFGVLFSNFLTFGLMSYCCMRLLHGTWNEFFVSQIPAMSISAIIAICLLLFRYLLVLYGATDIQLLAVLLSAAIGLYVTFLLLPVPFVEQPRNLLLTQLEQMGFRSYVRQFRLLVNSA